MARGLISVTNSGLTEIADYLDQLGDDYEKAIFEATKAMQDVVVERMRFNASSMIGSVTGSFISDSVGKSTEMSKNDTNVVIGTIGVYNLDSVKSNYNVSDKDLNAAQLAYWIEYGTSGLKNRRKIRGVSNSNEEHKTSVDPKPFLGNAMYGSINEQNDAFRIVFNNYLGTS